jgi:RND family efflux transporter MFP subunit
MKRLLRWFIVAAVIGSVSVAVFRLMSGGRQVQSQTAPPAQPSALELSPADIVTVTQGTGTRTLEVSGTVKAVDTALVKARVAGEIVRIHAREGETVKAGQRLVEQDTTELDLRLRQAEQQVTASRAQLEIAQRTLTNNRALVTQGFISATALESSISNEAAAQANLLVALAAVDLARKARADATLLAPISGMVAQRLAQPGERVGLDARILEIVSLSRLEVEAAVPAEAVAELKPGRPVRFVVDGLDSSFTGKVARLNPSAQAGSRAVSVYLSIDSHPQLRQGLFARGVVTLEQRRGLWLPASAVRIDRAVPYVLALEGGKVSARTVRTGLRSRADEPAPQPSQEQGTDRVEILDGLAEGAQVLAGSVSAVSEGRAWKPSKAQQPAGAGSTSAAPATAAALR